ncbi:thermonuclease family protein [Chitiniphilus shinanonensis]|nr:thermonuclease family protein [Chitiniphilus shinanonensis]
MMLGLIALPNTSSAADWVGRVVGIADGGVVVARNEAGAMLRVRLAGVELPEPGQPFSNAAELALVDLCYQKQARIRVEKKSAAAPRVAQVHCAGVNVNLAMVLAGMAWASRTAQHDTRIAQAEVLARQGRYGLWQAPAPMSPWEWRRCRKRGQCGTPSDAPATRLGSLAM